MRFLKILLLALLLWAGLLDCRSQSVGDGGVGTIRDRVVGSLSKVSTDPTVRSTIFLDGVQLYLFGRHSQALEAFGSLNKSLGDYAPAYYYMSLSSLALGDTVSALGYIDRSLDISPSGVDYLRTKANIQLSSNDLSGAHLTLERIHELLPTHQETLCFLAYVLLVNPSSSEEQLTRGFELATEYESRYGFVDQLIVPKNLYLYNHNMVGELVEYSSSIVSAQPTAQNYANYARVLATVGRHQEAQAALESARLLDPLDPDILSSVADYWRLMGNSQKFIETLRPLMGDSNVTSESKIEIFKTYFQMGGDATSDLSRELMEISVSSASDTLFNTFFSDYLYYVSDFSRAEVFLDSLVRVGNYTANQGTFLIQIYAQKDTLDAALWVLDDMRERFADQGNLDAMAIHLYLLDSRFRDASRITSSMLSRADSDSLRSVAYVLRSEIASMQGRLSSQISSLKKAIKYDSLNHLALNNYAYLISNLTNKISKLEYALELSVLANQLTESNSSYIDTHAWILFRLGRISDARQKILYLLAIDKEPSYEVLVHAVSIMEASGDPSGAERYRKMITQMIESSGGVD